MGMMSYKYKNSSYEYEIDVDNLIPPIANTLTHYAKIPYCYVTDKKGRRKIDHIFGEVHGKTPQEASERMENSFKEWVKSANT